MAGSRLLITGAAGFIGSYLMDLFGYANENYFDKPCEVVGVDTWVAASRTPVLTPHVMLGSAIVEGFDWCVHAASIASPKIYMAKPLETIAANIDLTRQVLGMSTAARGVLHMSSSEVYGDPLVVPTPETYWGNVSFTGPRAVYDESKRLSETLCQIYFQQFGVPVKVARPFNIYGPGQCLDDGRVVPQLIRSVLKDETFPIYGGGYATRSFCYVADAVVQLLAVLLDGQPGEAYNVGDSISELTIAKLALEARRWLPGLKINIVAQHDTLTDAPTRRRPDTNKVSKLAAYPVTTLDQGIKRTFAYYANRNFDI